LIHPFHEAETEIAAAATAATVETAPKTTKSTATAATAAPLRCGPGREQQQD
jgi:hypothetical protein